MTNEVQRTMEFVIKQQESFAESMEKADGRLNILITTVERYFNDKRNGESRG
jgi:hypothetical protein